jgi:hypothetical protein
LAEIVLIEPPSSPFARPIAAYDSQAPQLLPQPRGIWLICGWADTRQIWQDASAHHQSSMRRTAPLIRGDDGEPKTD